jgi:hypothetical protein
MGSYRMLVLFARRTHQFFNTLLQAALMIFVLDTAIGLGIFLPFTLGKTTALLSVRPGLFKYDVLLTDIPSWIHRDSYRFSIYQSARFAL